MKEKSTDLGTIHLLSNRTVTVQRTDMESLMACLIYLGKNFYSEEKYKISIIKYHGTKRI
jgi:hypothetical protein